MWLSRGGPSETSIWGVLFPFHVARVAHVDCQHPLAPLSSCQVDGQPPVGNTASLMAEEGESMRENLTARNYMLFLPRLH